MEFRNFFYTDVQGKECKIIYTGTFEREELMVMNPSSIWCSPGSDEERYVDDVTVVSHDFYQMDQELQEELVNEAFQHFDAFIDEMITAAQEER